jgi:hypothetical protein
MAISNQPAGKKEEIALRRSEVLKLRIVGMSYGAIATAKGVSKQTIATDIAAVLGELKRQQLDDADQLRAVECARLDMAMMAIAVKVRSGDYQAIDRWIRISERRSRLLGIDRQPGSDEGGGVTLQIVMSTLCPPEAKQVDSTVIEPPALPPATTENEEDNAANLLATTA